MRFSVSPLYCLLFFGLLYVPFYSDFIRKSYFSLYIFFFFLIFVVVMIHMWQQLTHELPGKFKKRHWCHRRDARLKQQPNKWTNEDSRTVDCWVWLSRTIGILYFFVAVILFENIYLFWAAKQSIDGYGLRHRRSSSVSKSNSLFFF